MSLLTPYLGQGYETLFLTKKIVCSIKHNKVTLSPESKLLFLKNPTTGTPAPSPNWVKAQDIVLYCTHSYISLSHNNTTLSTHRGVEWLFCILVCSWGSEKHMDHGVLRFQLEVWYWKGSTWYSDALYPPHRGAIPSGFTSPPPSACRAPLSMMCRLQIPYTVTRLQVYQAIYVLLQDLQYVP